MTRSGRGVRGIRKAKMTREWWWGVGWARTRAQSKLETKGRRAKSALKERVMVI